MPDPGLVNLGQISKAWVEALGKLIKKEQDELIAHLEESMRLHEEASELYRKGKKELWPRAERLRLKGDDEAEKAGEIENMIKGKKEALRAWQQLYDHFKSVLRNG